MCTFLHRSAPLLRWSLLLLWSLALLSPEATRAQGYTPPATYSMVVRGVPLHTALEQLVSQAQIDLSYDPALVAGQRTSCVRERATAEELLRCLLQDTGLDFYRLSSGTYVLTVTTETAPRYGQLSGIVVDAETGQPLPQAHVLLSLGQTGTTANDAGMFAFARLRPGRYVVTASYVGYHFGSATVVVPPGGRAQTQLQLHAEPVLVAPIVVDGIDWRLPSASLGTATRSQEELLRPPGGGGSASLLAGLNAMLGVRVSDATADIHVQGGETGEHQLRLDGAPVFLPLSFASFVGPFSPFAIGRVTIHKAGFDASEGSQIAGVIDLAHDLTLDRPERVDVQLDPLSLNVRASLQRGRPGGLHATLTTAARYGLWDLYAPPALAGLLRQWNTTDPFLLTAYDRTTDNPLFRVDSTTGDPGIGFLDLHAAGRIRFGLLQSLHTSAYWGRSQLGSNLAQGREPLARDAFDPAADGTPAPYRDRFTWETGVAQARYETVLGTRTLASLRLRGSYYRVRHDYSVPDSTVTSLDAAAADEAARSAGTHLLARPDDGNRVHEVAVGVQVDHALGDRHSVRWGTELIHNGNRFVVLGTQRFPIRHASSTWRVAGYLEDEFALAAGASVEAGSRLTYLAAHRRVYPEPRLAFRLDRPGGRLGAWSLRLSTGLYRQFVNQLDISSRSPRTLLSSTRFWLVADSTVRPPMATHLAGELLWEPAPAWTVRLEGFLKQQQHILAVDYATQAGADAVDMQQRAFLRASRGFVRGAGLQVERRLGAAGRAEVRYEYSRAERTNADFFEGQSQRAPWNEPHRLELGLDVMPLPYLTLLARWRGIWGRTWGFRQAYYDFYGAIKDREGTDLPASLLEKIFRQDALYHFGRPDAHRLDPFYQLDLSLAYTRPLGGLHLQLRADLLNVLDRTNAAEWYLVYNPETYYRPDVTGGYLERGTRPLLPRHLSLALRLTW